MTLFKDNDSDDGDRRRTQHYIIIALCFCSCAYRELPTLASAHHELGRGSPGKFEGQHLQMGLKFHICAPITLVVVGVTSRNFTRGCGS